MIVFVGADKMKMRTIVTGGRAYIWTDGMIGWFAGGRSLGDEDWTRAFHLARVYKELDSP